MEMILVEDCCEILDSKRIPITAKDRIPGPYPYYGANGIQDYVDNYIFDDELVLLAEDGGNFGSTEKPIAYRVSGKCWVNNHAHVLKPKQGIDVDYLCYSLMFYDTSGLVNGATRQKLTQSTLKKMCIPKRTVKQQLQIVQELNIIKKLITARNQELQRLDDLIKARFVELFGDPATPGDKFKTCKLGEVADVKSSHRVFTTEFVDEGVPFYRGTEIGVLASGQRPEDPYRISMEHYLKIASDDSKPMRGDLLLPSICNKGQVWMVDTDEPFYYKDGRVLCISPNQSVFDPRYLQLYMKMRTEAEYPKLGSGSTFAEFKIFQLKELEVDIPPMDLQNQFADFVAQIDKSKLLSGCRLFHSWAPENRDKPKHVGVPRRRTKDLRGVRRQHAPHGPAGFSCNKS